MIDLGWMSYARSLIGTREVPGPKHSGVIAGWLAKLGVWWRDDETPWCGAFAAHVMQHSGYPVPKAWYRAKAWADWGQGCTLVFGAVAVFDRAGGGHVGFVIGHSATRVRVLGGNQGNAVSEMWLERSRLIATRWPAGVAMIGKLVWLAENGEPLSKNEA